MAKKKSADKPVTKPAVSDVSEKKTSDEAVAAPTQKRSTLAQALFWLAVWTALFFCWKGCSAVYDRGLPTIRFEWRRNDAKSTLGRWILAERPALLKGDYPAVGRALGETARRLRARELENMNAAAADTIARVQPEVSDPGTWRTFLSRLGGQIEGGSLEKLADQYDEAASYFLPKAVQSLLSANGANDCRDDAEANEDEKVDTPDDSEAGDCGGALVDGRPNEDEDLSVGGEEDRGAVPEDEREVGGNRAAAGCPGGQCPAPSYSGSYSPYSWPSYGLPW